MTISLVYVSVSIIPPAAAGDELSAIIAGARERNAALGVTGCLVAAREYFAQVLEGEQEAVNALMASIRNDPRHIGMNIVEVATIQERRFSGWSLAYAGPSTYVEGRIIPLLPALQAADKRVATVRQLITLMREFLDPQAFGSAHG